MHYILKRKGTGSFRPAVFIDPAATIDISSPVQSPSGCIGLSYPGPRIPWYLYARFFYP